MDQWPIVIGLAISLVCIGWTKGLPSASVGLNMFSKSTAPSFTAPLRLYEVREQLCSKPALNANSRLVWQEVVWT
jgi:hypothetical protein